MATTSITDYIDTLNTEIDPIHYTVVIAALTHFFAIKRDILKLAHKIDSVY